MSNTENNEVLKRIQILCHDRSWTIYKLSQEAKIPYSSLNNIFIRNTQPTVPTLQKICDGFNITMSAFFSETTPIPNDLTLAERNIVDTFRALNNKDKKLFHAYLDGLAKRAAAF